MHHLRSDGKYWTYQYLLFAREGERRPSHQKPLGVIRWTGYQIHHIKYMQYTSQPFAAND